MLEVGGSVWRIRMGKIKRYDQRLMVAVEERDLLASGVFFDFAEFYFNSLLFSQDEENHPRQQNQNHCHCEDKYVANDAHHDKIQAQGNGHGA